MWSKIKESINNNIKLLIRIIEDLWVKYSIVICIVLALIFATTHYLGFLINVRELVDSIINFSSIVIGVTGVFLTLIVTLKESPVFERLKKYFPIINKTLYFSLRNQIFYGLVVVIISILINSLPASPYRFLSSIGVGIWFFFFWKLTLGSFYTVKLITDLVVRNFDDTERKLRI